MRRVVWLQGAALVLAWMLVAGCDVESDDQSGDIAAEEVAGEAQEEAIGDPGEEAVSEPSEEAMGEAAQETADDVPAETGGGFALVFSGAGFNPHEGQALHVAVYDQYTYATVASDSAAVAGGMFSFGWPDLLEGGHAYAVYYYADLNGSGACDAPPADHAWSVPVEAVTHDVSIEVGHNTDFDLGTCDFF